MRNKRLAASLALAWMTGCAPATPPTTRAPASTPQPAPVASAAPSATPAPSSDAASVAAAPAPPAEPLGEPVVIKKTDPRVAASPTPVPRRKGVKGPPDLDAKGEMMGDEIGDSFGAGGLGLAGVGEGGGGEGEGIGLGSLGRGSGFGSGSGYGSGSGRLGRSHRAKPPRVRGGSATVRGRSRSPGGQRSGVKAGEWDDNANFREFQAYLDKEKSLGFEKMDMSKRRFIVVKDSLGKPVPNCPITVADKQSTLQLTTTAGGRALLFPQAEGLSGNQIQVTAQCQGQTEVATTTLTKPDGVVTLTLSAPRALPKVRTVDVAFILDTTGSMSEEIDALKKTIQEVAKIIEGAGIHLRVGLVEYRDRTDAFVARIHPMTTDVDAFRDRVGSLSANGGGDRPEDVIEGLRAAVDGLAWSRRSLARVAFLIGDAPPQLSYGDGTYFQSVKHATQKGIRIYTVAASGQDDIGQVIWRQIAQYTGGTNMFVLRGGAGPQSVGGGKPKTSCGGTEEQFTSGNLAQLISDRVRQEVKALDGDPLRIAGLHQDEKAKPCAQRVAQQQ